MAMHEQKAGCSVGVVQRGAETLPGHNTGSAAAVALPCAAVVHEAPRPKRGKQTSAPRTCVLKVRLSDDELWRVLTAAGAQGLEMSTWCRRALLLRADREATYKPPPPLAIDSREAEIMSLHRKAGENGK